MNHMDHIGELAAINAVTDTAKWSSWGSPVGLVIFFNGMALFALLIRFIFLMK